ncbi:8013_t:CDS:2, partial [Cetraspora pellucida]
SDVNYSEPLESLSKKIIELQNALLANNHYLQDVKPDWKYNLHNKNVFSDLYAQFDGLLKDMKKKELGELKSTDGLTTKEIWHILNHEVLDPNTPLGLLKQQIVNIPNEIDGSQFDLTISFPSDLQNVAEPNANIRKYISLCPKNSKCSNFYLFASRSSNAIVKENWYLDKPLADCTIQSFFKLICIECRINIEKRNISNHSNRRTSIMELFSIRVPENTGHAISEHKSSDGYYAYAKPTDNHNREALVNILNKIIASSSSSTEAFQNSIKDSDSKADDYKDLQNYIFEDDYISKDISAQVII